MIRRRGLLLGLGATIAAPALIRAGLLMPISMRGLALPLPPGTFILTGWDSDGNRISERVGEQNGHVVIPHRFVSIENGLNGVLERMSPGGTLFVPANYSEVTSFLRFGDMVPISA